MNVIYKINIDFFKNTLLQKKGVFTIPRRDPVLVRKSLQKCNAVWNVKIYECAY